MRVKLGRRAEYAILAVIDLTRHPDCNPRKANQIAAAMDIPPGFLKRVLADLVAAGVLDSGAGPRGGYRLRGAPEAISLLAVIDAAEGPSSITHCVLRGTPCDWGEACAIHSAIVDAQEACRDSLAHVSVASVAAVAGDSPVG